MWFSKKSVAAIWQKVTRSSDDLRLLTPLKKIIAVPFGAYILSRQFVIKNKIMTMRIMMVLMQ
jgi:hypothetical protein